MMTLHFAHIGPRCKGQCQNLVQIVRFQIKRCEGLHLKKGAEHHGPVRFGVVIPLET